MPAGLPGEEVFILPRRCRISLLSPSFPVIQREGLWYSTSTSYHDLITWPEHKGRSVSSEMSPLFLDLAQELTHQNCLRKKTMQLLFFPCKIYFFSTGLSTTFVHTNVRSFIHPPENPIVLQLQLMVFRSGLIEPFMADVLNTSHDWPGNRRGTNQQTSSEAPCSKIT